MSNPNELPYDEDKVQEHLQKGGNIQFNADGTVTFFDEDGNEVSNDSFRK